MKSWHMFAYFALGAFVMLTNTVNTLVSNTLNPILSAVKGSYT